MNNKKNIKKEIISSLRSISILLISLIIINLGYSLASIFNITDSKLVWTMDYGIFSIALSLVFSIIHYFFINRKLVVSVVVLNKKEEINQITIAYKQPAEISLKLHINGKYRKLSRPLEIIFPYWIDFQVQPRPYLKEIIDKNKCEIDLEYLIKNKQNVSLNETITFDITANQEGVQDDMIDVKFNYNILWKFMNLTIEDSGLKVKKGE